MGDMGSNSNAFEFSTVGRGSEKAVQLTSWHWESAWQVTLAQTSVPTQTPLEQRSLTVSDLPSLHLRHKISTTKKGAEHRRPSKSSTYNVSSGRKRFCKQAPLTQAARVHGLLSC